LPEEYKAVSLHTATVYSDIKSRLGDITRINPPGVNKADARRLPHILMLCPGIFDRTFPTSSARKFWKYRSLVWKLRQTYSPTKFYFINADVLRNCKETVLPIGLKSVRKKLGDQAVEGLPITFAEACAGSRTGSICTVSHRWIGKDHPDEKGEQLEQIKRHLEVNKDIKYVWYDAWCMYQEKDKEGRNPEETKEFAAMLADCNLLYIGTSVLILLDRQYIGRFWCLMESWLAMQEPTAEGLSPTATTNGVSERYHISIPTRNESQPWAKDLETHLEETSKLGHDEFIELLNCDDVWVTNQSDKEQQIKKIQMFVEKAKKAYAEEANSGNTDSGNTDSGNTDSGNTDPWSMEYKHASLLQTFKRLLDDATQDRAAPLLLPLISTSAKLETLKEECPQELRGLFDLRFSTWPGPGPPVSKNTTHIKWPESPEICVAAALLAHERLCHIYDQSPSSQEIIIKAQRDNHDSFGHSLEGSVLQTTLNTEAAKPPLEKINLSGVHLERGNSGAHLERGMGMVEPSGAAESDAQWRMKSEKLDEYRKSHSHFLRRERTQTDLTKLPSFQREFPGRVRGHMNASASDAMVPLPTLADAPVQKF